MKKSVIFVLIIIFSLIILTSSCQNLPRNYVALGDSVSFGYGLSIHEESYPALFFELLKEEGYVDNYINMAVNGFTTTLLLEYLNNLDVEKSNMLGNAKIVTLNIGGNNILIPFANYLSNSGVVSGADTIKTGTETFVSGAWEFISGIRSSIDSVLSDSEVNESSYQSIISGLGNIIIGFSSIISGTGEILSSSPEILNTLSGSFPPELKNELEIGVQKFSDEFKEIINLIKQKAPKATIIVNTIYNPVPQEVLSSSLEISLAANVLIESMNNVIIQESKIRGFLVTDTYSHFSNQLNLTMFNIRPSAGNLSFDIVHPNAEGHKLIAQLNYDTFKNFETNK